MQVVRCPQCSQDLVIAPELVGAVANCPHCGAMVSLSGGMAQEDVIDVKAQVVQEDLPSDSGQASADSGSYEVGAPHPEDREQERYEFELRRHYQGNNGCCAFGCFLLLLFIFFAMRGCMDVLF